MHILLSEVARKNRVEVMRWSEKKDERLFLCRKDYRQDVVWLVGFSLLLTFHLKPEKPVF